MSLMSFVVESARHSLAGLRMLGALTIVLGLAYPVAVWGVGQLVFADVADGSLVSRGGDVVGSELLGQEFTGAEWFHGRPSAVGYDAQGSAASNYGPNNPDLVAQIEQRRADVANTNGVDGADVPPDAVTASASGLDPFISPEYAEIQVERVARARGLDPDVVRRLVGDNTAGRSLGFLGQPRVHILNLNLDLERETLKS